MEKQELITELNNELFVPSAESSFYLILLEKINLVVGMIVKRLLLSLII